MPKLENVRIARPCNADWSKMHGDERVRTCDDCHKQVFDLSALTRAEAEALIAEKKGNLCGRFYQRKDGTIVLADCTIGGTGARTRNLIAAGALVAATALARFRHPSPPERAAAISVPDPVETTSGEVSGTEHEAPPPAAVVHPHHAMPVMGHVHHQPAPAPEPAPMMMGDVSFETPDGK